MQTLLACGLVVVAAIAIGLYFIVRKTSKPPKRKFRKLKVKPDVTDILQDVSYDWRGNKSTHLN